VLTTSRYHRNRALSIRSGKHSTAQPSSTNSTFNSHSHSRHGFSFTSLRGSIQPELSRRLFRLIKSQNNLISAHDTAARERSSIASQLSEWGEQAADPGVVDLSDKIGVVLAELAELDEAYSQRLDDARGHLKAIRNTEKSVQPSRDTRGKIADEIGKLKLKEPESTKLLTLEQELVRAEAENLVAEAQLSNIVRLSTVDITGVRRHSI
jgi:seryl-tRNA synthetase